MDIQTRDTLKKVADYAAEKEKGNQIKLIYFALGVCLVLIACTLLFLPRPGFLWGIVDEGLCYAMTAVPYGLAIMLLVFYIRVLPFLEKPTAEPEKTVRAMVSSKEIRSGTHNSGRSQQGYSFLVTFRTDHGEHLELYAYDVEYGGLEEGMEGNLTYRGRYFVGFERASE